MTEIAEELKQLRKERNLTQQQLADALHVTRQSVSNWERGENLPDIETIVTIATTYKVPLDVLILGKDGESEMKEKLVRDGSDAQRAKTNLKTSLIGAVLMGMGFIFWIIKSMSVEYVDAQGMLHESFWLIPTGLLFIFVGALLVLASNIRFVLRRRRG